MNTDETTYKLTQVAESIADDLALTRPSEMAVNEFRRWLRVRAHVSDTLAAFVPGFRIVDWEAATERLVR